MRSSPSNFFTCVPIETISPTPAALGIGQHLGKALRQSIIVKMAVAIDDEKAQFFAGASPSST